MTPIPFCLIIKRSSREGGGIGRHTRLKICRALPVGVQVPLLLPVSFFIMESNQSLLSLIKNLEERITVLEKENVETTNVLYEIQNRIDMVISYIPDNYDLTL